MTAATRFAFMRPHIDTLRGWAKRIDLERKIALGLTVAAVISGTATVVAWTGAGEFGPKTSNVLLLLYLDTVLLLMLGVLIVRNVMRVWAERRRGLAGSGLHVRIVVMFSLVATTPAILVAVFSALFLNFGVQAWFSERVRTAIEASNAVAHAYLEEHRQSIRADAFAIADNLNREAPSLVDNPVLFSQRLALLADLRSISEAIVVDGSGRVLARSPFSLALELDLVPGEAIEAARSGDIVVIASPYQDRVRAAIRLNRFVDAFLLLGRFVDPDVLEHITRTAGAVAQYQQLEQRREGILITFVMIFVVVALMLLLAAVWIGMALATQISRPISALIGAAGRVHDGDLTARVDPSTSVAEIGVLGRAFNRMTSQLHSQQEGLISANRDLDERRRFTETVLSGVSAGVIGLDRDALINLPNRSASELLGSPLDDAIGTPLDRIVPEMKPLLENARARPDRQWQAELKLMRSGQPRTLVVRISAERGGAGEGEVLGYVVTFDDVSALVSAQRKAAWADVARRIAHEIKNPLTPIQLASERLKRKYLRQIQTDPETFAACTDTISRQVEDIGRMVDEFSAFARMPRPDIKPENLGRLVEEAVFLERNRSPAINFVLKIPKEKILLRCDGRQISQVLTNVLKNASEAIAGREPVAGQPLPKGEVAVSVERNRIDDLRERISVMISDNGRGLPTEDRDRLTEPYMTTRAKGTGLGLAIVKKIMEDHNAELILEDRDGGGASVSIAFVRPLAEDLGEGGAADQERGRARPSKSKKVGADG